MCAVAKGSVAGLFALAEKGLPVFFSDEGFRRKGRPLVRTVAKGLIGGIAAGAKVIFLPGFEIDGNRLVIGDGWFVHEYIFEVCI